MAILKSKNLVPPEATALVYSRDLRKLVKEMIKDYKSLIGIYREKKDQIAIDDEKGSWLTTDIQARLHKLGSKWEKKFIEFAEYNSPKVVKKVLKSTDLQLKRALVHFFSNERLELIGDNVIPNSLKQVMNAHIIENVSLIKSIQSQYHKRIVGEITRSITSAGSIQELAEVISKYNKKGLDRAKLIAEDQTRKMYSTMNLQRFQQLGIKKVQWLHTHLKETSRPYHIRKWDGDYSNYPHVNGLNGLIFDINNPPVIQEATKSQPEIRGYPAQLPFCRCIMRAIIDPDEV